MSIATVHQHPPPLTASHGAAAPVSLATVKELLRGLNREQRVAVTHRHGPLLVVAGPGTGKTETLTRRIAWLIAAKLARPSEILALTFTDNAAHEMQARVDVLVPYGQADAQIHTFHAFGDRVLREFSFELGLSGEARLINRAEAIMLLRENLFELGLERYLPLGDPTRFAGALVDLFSRAKEENVSADDLQAHADGLLQGLAAGSVNAELTDLAAARTELARAYRYYGELMLARGLIDHADQVALPLRLLRERPSVRSALHARHRYLLVDELQDANAAQVDFVLGLSAGAGDVTVVGDADQAIYTFRGAGSGNFERLAASLPAVRRVVLRRNYRSRAPLIEAAQRLIGHNGERDAAGCEQVAQRRGRRQAAVRLRSYRTAEEEADGIADQIAERLEAGAKPGEFAVLVRSNHETDTILRSLRVRGVPAHNGARPALLALPVVRALVAFLRVVADTSNNLELYTLAASQPYALSGADLNPWLQAARRRHRPLWDTIVEMADAVEGNASGSARAAALVGHVRAGVEMSADHTSGEVLYGYLRRSGLLGRLARLSDDGPDITGLRGIARFAELVRGRASLLAVDRVPFLVPHLERLAEVDVEVEMEGPRPEHVAVLTVHRAKGLEFKVVYLAGLVDGRFPVRARPPLLSLPAELISRRPGDEERLVEERRLFYVAMTRACDELWFSHHVAGPGGRGRRRPSQFIAEAIDAPPVADGEQAPSVADVERIGTLLAPPPVPQLAARPTGGSLSLSFSQVDEYLSCPERYRLRYAVGLATPAHHALSYGSALHQAIAAFHVRQGQATPMAEQELLAEFARHWNGEGFISREHEEARYAAGQAALGRFRTQQLASGVTPIAIERPFRFRLGQDQIVGRIDRLDRTRDGVVITDYKSSDVRDQKRADTKARDSLQLQVYALAHEAETGALPARVQLHFIDSGVVGGAAPEPDRLERAKATLVGAADGIRSGKFTPRPSAITCGYCPFREICPASAA